MKKLILFLCLALLLAWLPACGAPATPAPPAGGDVPADGDNPAGEEKQLIVAVDPDYESFDPAVTYEAYGMLILHACYDNLLEFVGSLENLQPSAAESFETSEDGLTYTFTLRPDIKFSSGNPLTAADVKWSVERAIMIGGNASFMAEGLEAVEAPDAATVVFRLRETDPSFPVKLTYNFFSILDSKAAQEHGAMSEEDLAAARGPEDGSAAFVATDVSDTAKAWLDSNSAGSGPYVIESYTPKVEVVLARNVNYWGEAPYYDKITVSTIADSNAQAMMLQQGDIDVAFNLGPEQISPLEGKDGITVMDRQTLTASFLLMNCSEEIGGPVADPLVQKAIRLALDYPGIQSIAGVDTATPVAPFPLGLLGSLPPLDPAGYPRLEEAQALMSEAGFADGFAVDFYVPTTNIIGVDFVTLAQKIQSDLAAIGIRTTIVPEDIMISLETYRTGQQPLGLWYWNPDYPDNNSQLAFLPGNSVGLRANWTADMNPELAALAAGAATETDPEARIALFGQIQKTMSEDAPFAMLMQHTGQYAINSNLKNAEYIDRYYLDLKRINE
ncbi:MAG: ABC transporter substrate-binding protein [Peptococcaceae bacterium]|jgi:peptide/nickel transport system substrate-binding protein|nr:ABC transporter substrate-binding protein [Peptococcaceae bacterium]